MQFPPSITVSPSNQRLSTMERCQSCLLLLLQPPTTAVAVNIISFCIDDNYHCFSKPSNYVIAMERTHFACKIEIDGKHRSTRQTAAWPRPFHCIMFILCWSIWVWDICIVLNYTSVLKQRDSTETVTSFFNLCIKMEVKYFCQLRNGHLTTAREVDWAMRM